MRLKTLVTVAFRAVFVLGLFVVFGIGGRTGAQSRSELSKGGGHILRGQGHWEKTPQTVMPALNPVIGEVVWVSLDGHHAVLWLKDRPPEEFKKKLCALDGALNPVVLLGVVRHRVSSRAVGVVVERGAVSVGREVVWAGEAMLARMDENLKTKN